MSSIFSQHIFPFIMELNTEFFMCVCLLSLRLCRLRLWFSPSKNVWIQKWGNGRAFGQNQKVAWKEKSTVARKTSELLIFTTQYHRNNLTNIFWMFTLRQGIQTHTAPKKASFTLSDIQLKLSSRTIWEKFLIPHSWQSC